MAAMCTFACALVLSAGTRINATDSSDSPVTGPAPPAELRKLDQSAHALIRRWNIPGASIAVCKDGKLLFSRGYGFADLENAVPVLPDKSLFRIASISKAITAAAVLKLADEKKLSLDDRVCQVLPESNKVFIRDRRLHDVTVRDLLQMSAGWDKDRSGDPILEPYIFKAARRMHKPSPADFDTTMQYVFARRLDFNPGTRFAYSNFEYGLLGKLIETRTGEDYESFVRKAFFEPAGVQLYKGHTRREDRLPNEVVYYAPLEPHARALFGGPTEVEAPYGRAYLESDLPILGWVSTAPELATLIDKITAPDGLLSASARQQMQARPGLPCWHNRHQYFGLGWEVRPDDKGGYSLYKDGTLPGTRTFVERTADGVTWVALFNSRPPQKLPDKFAHQVRDMMRAGLDPLVAKTPAVPESDTTVVLPPSAAQSRGL